MPMGERVEATGILRRGDWGYILDVGGGGWWRLDSVKPIGRFRGQQVIVTGIRGDFNTIDLDRLRLPTDPPGINRASFWRWVMGR